MRDATFFSSRRLLLVLPAKQGCSYCFRRPLSDLRYHPCVAEPVSLALPLAVLLEDETITARWCLSAVTTRGR